MDARAGLSVLQALADTPLPPGNTARGHVAASLTWPVEYEWMTLASRRPSLSIPHQELVTSGQAYSVLWLNGKDEGAQRREEPQYGRNLDPPHGTPHTQQIQ